MVESKVLRDYFMYIRDLLRRIKCEKHPSNVQDKQAQMIIDEERKTFVSIINCCLKYFFSIYAFSDVNSNLAHHIVSIKLWDPAFSPAEMATFYYYIGRVAILEEHYKEAEQYLETSLKLCDLMHERNISYAKLMGKVTYRRIMFYYIPVKIWSGVLPKKDVLQRFGFQLVSNE